MYFVLFNKPADLNMYPDGDSSLAEQKTDVNDEKEIPLMELLKSSTFWKLYVIFAFLTFCLYGLMLQLVPMLSGRGMDTTTAALAFSTIGTTIIIARIGIGYLLDKFFAPKLAMVCFLLSACGLALLAIGATGSMVFISAVLIGFSIGAELDILAYLITRYFGLGSFGMIYGILFTSFLVGVTTGPVAYAAVYEYYGSYINMLIACTLLLTLTAGLMLLLPKYKNEG
jgi:predicted MFS family arabinose efflux permease